MVFGCFSADFPFFRSPFLPPTLSIKDMAVICHIYNEQGDCRAFRNRSILWVNVVGEAKTCVFGPVFMTSPCAVVPEISRHGLTVTPRSVKI